LRWDLENIFAHAVLELQIPQSQLPKQLATSSRQ
jgi:hypothetical protein